MGGVRRKVADMCGFSLVAHQVIIVEKRARVPDVARRMGMSSSALYGRLQGRTPFRADEIRRLIEVVDDARLIAYFANDSAHVVGRRPRPNMSRADLLTALGGAIHQAGRLMEISSRTMSNGRSAPNHQELSALINQIREAETAMANLRLTVELGVVRDPHGLN